MPIKLFAQALNNTSVAVAKFKPYILKAGNYQGTLS